MGLVLVDVEANGLSPYSGMMTEFGAVEFKSRASFHGVLYDAEPDPENPAVPRLKLVQTRSEANQEEHERKVMQDFDHWLAQATKGRPILVSDNPAFDFMWMAFYLDKYLRRNPFGHSGRRISDYWAGLQGDFYNTQKWKRYRVTKHDHNPVHDAMGNAEALATIMAEEASCS